MTRFICEVGGDVIIEAESFVREIFSGGKMGPPWDAAGGRGVVAARAESPAGASFIEVSIEPNKSVKEQ